jgi:glycyl-tRNA synthetase beta chain
MPEFFLELFSEEIPAGMQRDAAVQLEKLCSTALQPLNINLIETFFGPRRIALSAVLSSETNKKMIEERGPRETAPDAALNGFLGKHGAKRDEIVIEAGYYVLRRAVAAVPAALFVSKEIPEAFAKFSWPKSMRWGQGGDFSWIRPLRRIACLLDGRVIPIKLGPITAGTETEGHRVLAPGAITVSSAEDWQEKLCAHYVIADQDERRHKITRGLAEQAAMRGLTIAEDEALLDEVTGLVEWPVPLIGKIEQGFMDLPPEVRELSMKVNQRYFALRDAAGKPAPYFAFVANLEAPDNGAAIIAGNERVLRARLSDARHFWDIDLKTPLNELLPKLDHITFHAKIGTQRQRADRIAALAKEIAEILRADGYDAKQAEWAGLLCKADLVTGMVGEFPELQGIIGGYYAEKNPRGWDANVVGPAIKTHYQPKGPSDDVPRGTVAVSVALADKLDTLREFFSVGEKPTGSGDPYALRRAALGVIRIILENELSEIDLGVICLGYDGLLDFIFDRLRVKLRGEGKRFDVLDAVFSVSADGNLVRLMQRVTSLSAFLEREEGTNLLAGYRRAINILRIAEAKDGDIRGAPDPAYFEEREERELFELLNGLVEPFRHDLESANFTPMMDGLAQLRAPVDRFFESVKVNVDDQVVQSNRLKLLAQLRGTMHSVGNFSKIEG